MPARRIPVEQRLREKTDTDGPIPAHRPELGQCHMFTGFRDGQGYGRLQVDGLSVPAPRVAWQIAHGPIEKGKMVCHHCDNPGCVRLTHLFLGNPRDNSHDAMRKGRLASGDKNGARLHPEKLARGDRNGSRLHPERLARGDKSGPRLHPERMPRGEKNGSRTHPEKRPRGMANTKAKLTDDQVLEIRAELQRGVTQMELGRRFGVNQTQISRISLRQTWKHIP